VHVFRDPAQTYASIKRTHHFKSRPPWYDGGDILREIIDVRWNPHVNAFRELVEREPKKHIALIYEEVIKKPHVEITKVCTFLGVEPPKSLTEQTVLGGSQ
jgi:LPS sulfotransferase NodH